MPKAVSICIPYVDYLVTATDQSVRDTGCPRGGSLAASPDMLADLIHQLPGQYIPGGPCANSLAVFCALGGQAVLFGRVAHDHPGQIFMNDCTQRGITFPLPALGADDHSPLTVIMVTPDGERSILYNRGCATKVVAGDLDPFAGLVADADIVLVGLSLRIEALRAGAHHLVSMAPRAKKLFSLQSLGAHQKDSLWFYLEHADVIFGNNDEMDLLATLLDRSIDQLALDHPRITWVWTRGPGGTKVIQGARRADFPAPRVEKIVDLNGAGDAFMGGFAIEWSQGHDWPACVATANRAAAAVIGQVGGRVVSRFG
jgi:sugar/nucleoside kinase (ribokinase family)